MNQKRIIGKCLVIVFLCSFSLAQAQFTTALEARFGGSSGIGVKHFYKPGIAAEGILGAFGNGVSLTGLLEKYIPVYEAPGLYGYFGGGAHLAVYNGLNSAHSNFGREVDYRKNNDVGIGVNGVVGLAYRLPNDIPIGFSLELKPFVEVGSGGHVSVAPDPAIGIQFIFK